MTISIEPVLRYMILCDDVQTDPANPRKVNVFGLVSTLEGGPNSSFPLHHPEFCAYIQVAGGRGNGQIRVEVIQADPEKVIFLGKLRKISFGTDPLSVKGLVFRIRKCAFPEPGLYWVQLRWEAKILGKQPLLVR